MAYIKNRIVKLLLKESDSAFLQVNRAFIERKAKIGSSISAVNGIMNERDMLKEILPLVTGISSNSTDWDKDARLYFDSLSKNVTEAGLSLETGFIFNSEDDYKKYMSEIDKIEDTYTKAIKANPNNKKIEAEKFKSKYESLRKLECSQYKYGKPINATDWLLYIYCLFYGDVANREEDVNNSVNIRFYIHDEMLAEKRKTRELNIVDTAEELYITIRKDSVKIDNILLASEKITIEEYSNLSSVDKLSKLRKFRDKEPLEFMNVANDKKLTQKAFVTICIALGLLKKLPHTNVVVNSDNEIIGNDVSEVIIKLEKNATFKNSLESQVKSKLKTAEVEVTEE